MSRDQAADYPNWEEFEINGMELSDQKSDLLCEMDLLFQIDSEDNLPYMFGDAGSAHITQCPNHPETLTIARACC
ncbi:hypothetical protein [uncultured Neptuniibacter sp.]|uniref:hypothetical protein n=1 Tax=uncultured Neptuniibacter sp. TaxID=502143 RepID=UPI0026337B38|nr:hypothetical protein [uncultured Neptuniibacter sp.]